MTLAEFFWDFLAPLLGIGGAYTWGFYSGKARGRSRALHDCGHDEKPSQPEG